MLSWLYRAWAIYAHASGVLVLTLACAWGILEMAARDGPVIERVSPVTLHTAHTPYLGRLRYSYDTRRYESCPGEVIYTATSQTNHGPQAVVTFRRPLRAIEINDRPIEANADVSLPESMFPARWHFISAVHSRCPTRERVDILAEFTFEVTR
ncbi:hypothetical protein ACFPOB_27280 [Bosea eneae]|uniref:Uncharacterized protein n=1 Tax=Bosea eneae TaxID=151454 RepID=A0ABW0IYT2_9HYPH